MKNHEILNILSDKKVLCADDEEGILSNIVEILEMFFQKVVGVSDGKKALEELECNSYDVLLFDICMPNMDGLEAISEIRKVNSKIPIIVLSAHTEHEYLWRAIELKITKFLTKPFEKDILLEALENVSLELVDNNILKDITTTCRYDFCKKRVIKDGKIINLSKSESRLIEFFLKNKNQVLSYDQILDYLWEFEKPTKEAIKSIVKELRKKVDSNIVKNVYGIGYICEI